MSDISTWSMNSPLNGWVVTYNICKLAISIFMICTDSMVKAALYSFSNPHLTKLSWYIFIQSLRIHYPQPALLLHYSPRVESMKTHQPKYNHCLHLMANYNSVYFSNRVHLCMHIIYIQPKCMQQCVVYGCTPANPYVVLVVLVSSVVFMVMWRLQGSHLEKIEMSIKSFVVLLIMQNA